MRSDEELIDAYRNGSATASNELMERYLKRVRASVYALVLNSEQADDLTQDILFRAFRALPTFRGGSKYSTWLYRIMINTTRNHLAQRSRRTTVPLTDTWSNAASDPAGVAITNELDQSIALALGELPLALRTAIVLVTMQGESVSEAARIEGCTSANIYWRLHQARKRLKQRIAKTLQ